MRFYIRYPRGKRRSFRVVQRDGTDKTVEHPSIDSINKAYLAKTLSEPECIINLKNLITQLYKNAGVFNIQIWNNENEAVLKKYWIAKCSRRPLIDKSSAYSALLRSIKAIGNLSLVSATFEELQDAVDSRHTGNKQRRIIQSLNQLLKFLNRDFQLNKVRPIKDKVKYLNEVELGAIISYLPDEATLLLHQACFYTGARIGEAFALEANCIGTDVVKIFEQVDKQGQVRETKNRKERFAFVEEKAIPILKRWILIKNRIDLKTRTRMSKITKKACKEAFPTIKAKHCKFHDLRHSYAISLVSKGVSLTAVAQCLGNSVLVCERYYVGHQLTTETVQMIKRIVTSR